MSWLGPKCPRCETRNSKEAEYCEHCGISMIAPRPAILKGNSWEAAPEEFAVFFKGRDVKGLFSKNMHVPSGMRGWVLQDNRVEELQEGEYNLETLPQRLNTFFAGKHAEILVSRQNAIPLPFRFDDIPSAELLQVTVETNIHVKVGDLAAFRNHFMLRTGAVTVPQLKELLSDSVRQILVEYMGGLHLEEMSTRPGLRQALADDIRRGLQHRFNDYGLAFDAVDTLTIRHDRFDANRNLMGSLWLDYDEAKKKAEHQKSLDELYEQAEWARIKKREEDLRRRYRNAELTQEEAEFGHVIRLRELALFEKITQANTREEAIHLGARDEVETLEHDYQAKRQQREKSVLREQWQEEDLQTGWQRTREIAGIRHAAEVKAENLRRDEADTIERKHIENKLEKIRIEGDIERARLIEDEQERKRQLAAHGDLLLKAGLREQGLLDARHRLAIDEVEISQETKKRETARIHAWEDKVLEEKLATVDLRIDKAGTDQGLDTLERMMRMKSDNDHTQIQLQTEQSLGQLKQKREQQAIQDEAAEKALDRELKKGKADREAKLDANAHEKEMTVIRGSLPPEVLLSITENEQALAAILDLAKTKMLVTADPETIRATLATATAHVAPDMFASREPFTQKSTTTDPLTEALQKFNADTRADLTKTIEIITSANDRAQGNLIEMGKFMKETAVGVAQAHSAPQAVQKDTPTQPAYATAAPAGNPYTMPFAMKNCSKCNTMNLATAKSCGECKQDF